MTFGGGYAMIPILEREIVENRKWASSEELMDYYAVGQCTPGVIAVNTATFIGYKVAGPTGGTKEIPVGTIWLACGNKDRVVTCKVEEDHGRDINLAIATSRAMQMFLQYLKDEEAEVAEK